MNDIFDKEKRPSIMRQVKSSENGSTELKLIFVFQKYSIKGWRRNDKIKGKPDFVFHKEKIAVFVDGCFRHGHDCRNTKPKDNACCWENKILRNKQRDIEVTLYLTKIGESNPNIGMRLKNKNLLILLEKLHSLSDLTN